MNIIPRIIEYIFPTRCLDCRQFGDVLCEKCLGKIPGANIPADNFIHACFSYKNSTLKYALWLLKYHGRFPIAKILGNILHEQNLDILAEKKMFGLGSEVLVVPVPITKSRKRGRGYNQSTLLAKAFTENSSEEEFIYAGEILEKIRETIPQAKLHNRTERLNNLRGAYALKKGIEIKGKSIILVDDVSTTGATLKEARRVLREAGARNVIALVVAH